MITKYKFTMRDLEKKYGPLTFAKFLMSWRLCEGLTQVQFSKKLGISKANLCDLEKGRKKVSPCRAAKIALILSLSEAGLIQIALQDILRDSNLSFQVEVDAA